MEAPINKRAGFDRARKPALREARIDLLVVAIALVPSVAHAHSVGESYVFLQVKENALAGRVEIALDDLDRALSLDADADGKVTDAELEALVLKVGRERDEELIPFFHRRLQRHEAILAPVMRELEGVEIQNIR